VTGRSCRSHNHSVYNSFRNCSREASSTIKALVTSLPLPAACPRHVLVLLLNTRSNSQCKYCQRSERCVAAACGNGRGGAISQSSPSVALRSFCQSRFALFWSCDTLLPSTWLRLTRWAAWTGCPHARCAARPCSRSLRPVSAASQMKPSGRDSAAD